MALLYGGARFDALGFELAPGSGVSKEASVAGVRSVPTAQSALAPARPASTLTNTPTSTPSPAPEPETALTALPADTRETPEPEREEPATPEPTATPLPPTATAAPPTPTLTPLPPTLTPTLSVARGVPVTPVKPAATGTPASFTGTLSGIATPYADSLAGNTMGCGGVYSPSDTSVVAVGPANYGAIPCGTLLRVCGPAGCINAVRTDSCPACSGNNIDLSRAGFNLVCGPAASQCSVTITRR